MILDNMIKQKIYCYNCNKEITDKEQYYEPDLWFIKTLCKECFYKKNIADNFELLEGE